MLRPSRRPASARGPRAGFLASAPSRRPPKPHTEREAGLDRVLALRVSIGARSQWIKRAGVFATSAFIGVGALQESAVLGWLAFPTAVLFWWLDAQLTRAEWRAKSLHEAVSAREVEPPMMGEESEAAAKMPEAPDVLRRALVSGPGVGLHWMMVGIAVLFNLLL